MIALDTSVLVTIAHREEGYRSFRGLIETTPCIIGSPTLLEMHMVLRGRKVVNPLAFFDMLQADLSLDVVPLALPHLHAARDAFDRYGKGRGHPAQLNYGDCMSYAVAKVADVPLLYAGRDFALTDIASALHPDRIP